MKKLAIACVFMCLTILNPGSATAATQSDYSVTYCDGGTHVGSGKNDLTNGQLGFGWCKNSSGKATTITVKYTKIFGGNISAKFGYEWTSSTAGTTAGRHWDQSANSTVTIEAGETWGARFRRDPAEAPPSSSTKCIRGLMKVGTTVYSTRVVCP